MNELREFYEGKKVLITGHTGFKGSWLCRLLLDLGAQVTGYALEPATEPALFRLAGLEGRICSVCGDVRDFGHLRRVFEETQPEIVFHLAAQPIVRTSYEEPVLTYETNVMGTVHVLECVRRCSSVRSFLNVTTDKVYLNLEHDYAFREDDPLDGYDPYSNSKSCSELATHSYVRSFFGDGRCAVSTARAGNVIGGGDFSKDRIIPDCIRAVTAGQPVPVRNPHSTRPFQHVLEPLAVYLRIAMRQYEDRAYAGYYNVGPDDADCVTTGQLADLFCAAWGDGASWLDRSDGGPHEANFLRLNCDKVKKTFGWQPRLHVDEAVGWTVEWTKAWLTGADMASVTDEQIRRFFNFDQTIA